MKKLVFGLMFISSIASAACQGPYCYDDTGAQIVGKVDLSGPFKLPAYTLAQIATLVGPTTGQALIECFNCTQGPGICKSTGTTAGAWVILASTGGAMGTLHCQ